MEIGTQMDKTKSMLTLESNLKTQIKIPLLKFSKKLMIKISLQLETNGTLLEDKVNTYIFEIILINS